MSLFLIYRAADHLVAAGDAAFAVLGGGLVVAAPGNANLLASLAASGLTFANASELLPALCGPATAILTGWDGARICVVASDARGVREFDSSPLVLAFGSDAPAAFRPLQRAVSELTERPNPHPESIAAQLKRVLRAVGRPARGTCPGFYAALERGVRIALPFEFTAPEARSAPQEAAGGERC